MYIIIAGDTLFALTLAKSFVNGHNKIIVVIRDKDKALEVSAEKGIIVVNGSTIQPTILNELKLEDCDVFVAATSSEEVNILSALYAKDAGANRIFVLTKKEETENILKKLGIATINPEVNAALNLNLKITRPAVADLVGIKEGQYDLIEINVNDYLNLIGKKIGEIYSSFFTTLATYKNGEYNFVSTSEITKDSKIIIICESGREKDVIKELKKFVAEKFK